MGHICTQISQNTDAFSDRSKEISVKLTEISVTRRGHTVDKSFPQTQCECWNRSCQDASRQLSVAISVRDKAAVVREVMQCFAPLQSVDFSSILKFHPRQWKQPMQQTQD